MRSLRIRQVSNKIERIRPFKEAAQGVTSWLRYIREAYGMSLRQLSQRSGISKSVIAQIEKGEELGQVTLRSLKQAAAALDCDFVYAFIPRQSLEEVIQQQARKKAVEIVRQSHLQMELEDQAVDQEALENQVKELVEELKESKQLWETS